jgi:hypothetical protein
MHKILYKGMEVPGIRETRERSEREHTEADGPFKTDEDPERIIEETSEPAETDKKEKL